MALQRISRGDRVFDEPFACGPSPVHGLDPRVRLCMAAAFSVTVAMVRHPGTAAAGLLMAMIALCASLPPKRALLRRVVLVNVFILFLWLTVPLTMPGEALWALGSIGVSREGFELVGMVTLKSNAILLVFLALVASMDSPTIGHAMAKLGVPSKLVFLFLFTYRYVHVIAEEWQRLRTAARLRGFVPRTDMRTYATVGHLFAMVLVRSLDRSARVYRAMILRGFDGRFASVCRFTIRPRDGLFVLCGLAAHILMIFMECFAGVLRV